MPFEVPARIANAIPDSVPLARTRKALVESTKPVRPLPSNAAMMLLCAGVFVVLAVLLAIPAGFHGFSRMTLWGRLIDYSVVLLLALVLAGSAVEQMIPGSRRIMRPVAGVIFSFLLLSVTASLLFPAFAPQDFVRQGIPCLRFGVLCAIPAGALTWILMRRGFVTDPVAGGIAAGALSGLLGVGVLALHCPILNATHIIAWHAGVIVVTSLAGALLGWSLPR